MHDGSDSDVSTQQQSHPGQDGGDEHGKDKGTGEQWIKSSGLQAEGGDFDASKPGAGREADRKLLLNLPARDMTLRFNANTPHQVCLNKRESRKTAVVQ